MLQRKSRDDSWGELERLRAAIEASGDVIYEWDLATDAIQWSGPVGKMLGLQVSAFPRNGDSFHSRVNPEDLPHRMKALSTHFTGTGAYDCEYRLRTEEGGFQWVHDRGAVELSSSGSPTRLVGILRLVTQRKQHEAHLEHLANYDNLTGHYNRLRLRDAIDHALAQGQRSSHEGAFLAVGIDQLGKINSVYGYEFGNAVLVEVGQRLDHCLRSTDVIGRLGSDRFGVLLNGNPELDANRAAERILEVVRQNPIKVADNRLHITVSIGVVCFPEHSRTCFDVMTKAESALLKAKSFGRDCAQIYEMTDEQRRDYRAHMDVGEVVTDALRDSRLVFAYQPIVDANTHEVRFYECLLRMREPDGTLVSAAKFIPVVEQMGLMRTIDRYVLDLALKDLEKHPDITLAFNISGLTAADRTWLRALASRLKTRPELAHRLIVEITETAALHDMEDSARFVTAVRNLGCQVAVDDFGAGYTTFRHLKALTVDMVKIDGSFVQNIRHCAENQLFVRNLLSLARTYNLVTVAECVESTEDAAFLTNEGVDFLQGYYFAKPSVAPSWRQEDQIQNPIALVATGY